MTYSGGQQGITLGANGGMVQILFSAGLVEFWSELQKPHYMSGGGSQKLPIWDPVGFTAGLSADELKTALETRTPLENLQSTDAKAKAADKAT